MKEQVARYNMQAICDAFLSAVERRRIPVGTYFRDRTGLRLRYAGKVVGSRVYVATHGDYAIVMRIGKAKGDHRDIQMELKEL